MYTLLFHRNLERKLRQQHGETKKRLSTIFNSLEKDPHSIGDTLHFLGGLLKEIHVDKYRLYFSISEEKGVVEVVGFGYIIAYEHKDEQDKFLRHLTKEKIKQIMENCVQKFKNQFCLL